tara:strand:- start:524 stop:985 length:462 start_codon:yes stop_codon:yes gene_type:complete
VLLVLGLIAYQDVRERMVHWILFPALALAMGYLFSERIGIHQYALLVFANLLLVSSIISILYLYTKYLRGMEFLDVSFGLGDLLFFLAFALGFPTLTFLILFTSSILFSLSIFLGMKKINGEKNAPLAGLMSFYLIIVYMISFLPSTPSLYIH